MSEAWEFKKLREGFKTKGNVKKCIKVEASSESGVWMETK